MQVRRGRSWNILPIHPPFFFPFVPHAVSLARDLPPASYRRKCGRGGRVSRRVSKPALRAWVCRPLSNHSTHDTTLPPSPLFLFPVVPMYQCCWLLCHRVRPCGCLVRGLGAPQVSATHAPDPSVCSQGSQRPIHRRQVRGTRQPPAACRLTVGVVTVRGVHVHVHGYDFVFISVAPTPYPFPGCVQSVHPVPSVRPRVLLPGGVSRERAPSPPPSAPL